MKRPLLVGLTGGIGSGKSTIATIFKSLGVPIFNADEVAKNIINNDAEVIKKITAEFGKVYINGKIDRKEIAAIVFKNANALEKLNKIIHPKVAEYFKQWVEENKKVQILIKEAAILIESGAYKEVDKIVLVTAPKTIRIQRVIERDNTTKQNVLDRIEAQLADIEKSKYANFTIINDGKQLVIPQILKVLQGLKLNEL